MMTMSGGGFSSSSSFSILHQHQHQPKVLSSSPLILLRRGTCCKASFRSQKRNPDFSRARQNRGFSRARNRDSLDQGDINLSSKNGPLLSISNNPRYQSTASPGQREKEIVELFRKVQAQLRHRSAIKEEKKIEASSSSSSSQQGEKGTVDSLLKLLRKHSADQGNIIEDQNPFFFEASSIAADDDIHEPEPVVSTRPVSKFQRRSPVPRVKFQPVYSADEDTQLHSPSKPSSGQTEEEEEDEQEINSTQPELVLEPVFFDEREEAYEAQPSDSSDIEDAEQPSSIESPDLSSMKVSELRVVAKSRGVKGYSKLKKAELVKLLEAI